MIPLVRMIFIVQPNGYPIITKRNIVKLTQSVLLHGNHNRIYHHTPSLSKNHYHSIELPLDWLIYYDALSRVSRDPTKIHGYKLFSVPYLILPDKTKRGSHYHNCTEDSDTDWLISSKRMKITVCHSSQIMYTSTSRSLLRRNIFLPNVRYPFILNLNHAKCPSQNSTE